MSRPSVGENHVANWRRYAEELEAENKALRKAAKAVMKGCTRCWGEVTYSGRDFEPCVCSYCQTLKAALTEENKDD